MRLIDADALIEFVDPGHLRHPSELCYSEIDVVNLLNHAPTVEVPERVKGRWIERSYQHHYYTDIIFTSYACPFCGRVASRKEPFCNCGADMGGDDK